MADLFSNSVAYIPLSNPAYTPMRPFLPTPALSRSTPAGRWRRRRRKLPQITFFCKHNSQDVEVISTHEQDDGSFLFRFGDPSVLAEEDWLLESKLERAVYTKDAEEFNVDMTNISDSVLSRRESSSLLERGIDSYEQLLGYSYSSDCFASLAHQTRIQDYSEPNDRESNEKDDGEAVVSLTDNGSACVEVQAYPGNRELIKKSASQFSTKNAATLEEIVIEKDDSEASISLTDYCSASLEVQAGGGNRALTQKFLDDSSGSEVTGENAIVPKPLLDEVSHEIEETEDVESTEATEDGMPEVECDGESITNKVIQTTEFVLSSGAALLPHPSKAFIGGEDAYFVSNKNWLGVADGVGQWSLEGICPGVYSRELMECCEKVILQSGSDLGTDPKAVLKLSVEKLKSRGSSTALVAHFDGQVFRVANIGDSGFMIIRNDIVYKMSSPMLHEFNFPMLIESGGDPSLILEEYISELDEGDIVVTATNGLFDNLYAQEITSIVTKSLEANKTPKEIAEELATRAQEGGRAASGRSPFSDAAQATGYVWQSGGKLDDVAVIVSLVQNH